MNSPNQSNDPAPVDLTGHLRWMRALARGLVRDDAAADDLVQDAAVAALRDKAARPLDVRAWLGSILRNRARDAGRSRDAREAREAASARPESGEDTSELEQRAAIGAELSQRVLGLDEPLRSTLLMRYWDDLPPRVIAKRTGVPVATVKSRLARGLERLRRDLDASRGGDRKAWLVVVLPLAGKAPLVAAGSAVGWTVMNVKILAAATVVAATCAVLFLRDGRAETAAPLDEPTERAERFAGENGGFASSGSGGDGESAQRTGSRRGAGTEIPAATEAVTYTVEVKVVDGSGRPLSRVEVMLEDSDARAEADARGLAVLTASESTGSIVAADTEKWVTVRPGNWRSANPQTSLVVLAPRLDFQGRVVDAFGFGVEGAEVSFDLPRAFASRFDESFGASTRRDWNVRTDEDGAFLLEDAPGIEGASLIASREGYAAAAVEAPAQGASGVEITLRKPLDPDALPLRGRVVRRSGEAAPGARVSLGGELVAVDAEGLFELDLRLVGPAKVLRAIEAGALPARYEVQEDPSDARRGWPEFVELELGEAPLSIAGVVVDEKGDPLAGARVWLDDPTEFGALGVLPVRA
ncbi:MAG: RNA polymerase sigma factor, partial [Planctomycetota bacterium]